MTWIWTRLRVLSGRDWSVLNELESFLIHIYILEAQDCFGNFIWIFLIKHQVFPSDLLANGGDYNISPEPFFTVSLGGTSNTSSAVCPWT